MVLTWWRNLPVLRREQRQVPNVDGIVKNRHRYNHDSKWYNIKRETQFPMGFDENDIVAVLTVLAGALC
jgi:hypothetical protein